MTEPMGSVWCFESPHEQDSSWLLGEYIRETAESKDPDDIKTIQSFWNNEYDFDTILEMASVEGSTWYVWWMDGVRAFIRHEQGKAS
jgi:hypothetical protein